MKRTIATIIFVLSIIFVLGTLGAYDHDTIGTGQMWIQLIIGGIALAVSAYIIWMEDDRYGENM